MLSTGKKGAESMTFLFSSKKQKLIGKSSTDRNCIPNFRLKFNRRTKESIVERKNKLRGKETSLTLNLE